MFSKKNTSGFLRSESGTVALTAGLVITSITFLSTMTIDFVRAVDTKKAVQKYLDATLIHLARSDNRYDPQQPGDTFLREALKMTSFEVEDLNTTFVWNEDEASIAATVEFTSENITGSRFYDPFKTEITAKVAPKLLGAVEISLVLDNSRSMLFSVNNANSTQEVSAPNRRIDALHEAVGALFDAIYENPTVTPKVAVVPYANTVDISEIYVNNSSGYFVPANGRSSSSLQLDYMSDNDIRLYDDSANDNQYPHGKLRLKGIWAAERPLQNGPNGLEFSVAAPNSSARKIPILSQRYMYNYCSNSNQYNYGTRCVPKARRWSGDYYRYKGSYHPNIGVLSQTTDSQAVRDFVASFEPYGGTAGHIGAAWGLYALSPDWHDLFDHPAGQPSAFGEKEKHLVIMTDGQFNSPQQHNMDTDDLFDYFQKVCEQAEEKDVTVYTVGLLLQSDQMDQTLSNCVTHPKRYFKVDSKDELIEAFKNIGRVTTQVRISG